MRRYRAALVPLALGLSCTDAPTAPGRCPDFCPPGDVQFVDTLLATVITGDSAFEGYLEPATATALIGATAPGVVDSRPIMRFNPIGATVRLGSDTTQRPILATDSARLHLLIVRRDTNVTNLRVLVSRLAAAIDSNTTFGDVTGPFADSLVRVVNVDSLLDASNNKDTVTRDSVARVFQGVRVFIHLDSAQARFVAADSGTLAYGIRIAADAPTSAVLASGEAVDAPLIDWFFSVDSAGQTVHTDRTVAPVFDTYLIDPPAPPFGSTLAVGGMPAARSVMRVALPARLRDSTQILRATLLLVPAAPVVGIPADSFKLVAHAVAADLGSKSPLITSTNPADSSFFGSASVRIGSADTLRVEITRVLRRWVADTNAPMTMILHSGSEGVLLTQARFESSRNPALRPAVLLTYATRFPFGVP